MTLVRTESLFGTACHMSSDMAAATATESVNRNTRLPASATRLPLVSSTCSAEPPADEAVLVMQTFRGLRLQPEMWRSQRGEYRRRGRTHRWDRHGYRGHQRGCTQPAGPTNPSGC